MRFSGKLFLLPEPRAVWEPARHWNCERGRRCGCGLQGRKDAATGKISNVDMDRVVADIRALGRKAIGVMADVSKKRRGQGRRR